MLKTRQQYDCIVIGGGPAGTTLAMTLAGWGRSVAIIDEGRRGPRLPFEDLGPESLPLLKRLGLMTSLRHASRAAPRRRRMIWGDGAMIRDQLAAADFSVRVDRSLFDADLRGMARALGVDVYDSARIDEPLPDCGTGTIEIQTASGKKRLATEVFVIATGRRINTRLLSVAIESSGPDALTLVSAARIRGRKPRFDAIESMMNGFLRWQAPRIPGGWGQICFTTPGLPSREDAENVLAAAVEHSALGLGDVEIQPTRLFDSSPRFVTTKEPVFVIGSAAVGVDRVLGQSLEMAIADGEAAAVAINTAILQSSSKAAMLAHESKRQEERYYGALRSALGIYLQEARYSDQPFWSARHGAVRVEIESAEAPELPERLKVSDSVGRYQVYERRGILLEPTIGYGLPGGPVKSNVHRVLVEPLLSLVEEFHYTDDILGFAAKVPTLFMHSRQSLLHALSELCRLGILEGDCEVC